MRHLNHLDMRLVTEVAIRLLKSRILIRVVRLSLWHRGSLLRVLLKHVQARLC